MDPTRINNNNNNNYLQSYNVSGNSNIEEAEIICITTDTNRNVSELISDILKKQLILIQNVKLDTEVKAEDSFLTKGISPDCKIKGWDNPFYCKDPDVKKIIEFNKISNQIFTLIESRDFETICQEKGLWDQFMSFVTTQKTVENKENYRGWIRKGYAQITELINEIMAQVQLQHQLQIKAKPQPTFKLRLLFLKKAMENGLKTDQKVIVLLEKFLVDAESKFNAEVTDFLKTKKYAIISHK